MHALIVSLLQALSVLEVTAKRPAIQPGPAGSTINDVIKNISFAATRLYPPLRFDAENCLGGFWLQSNEYTHTATEPIENCAVTIDTSADYLYVLRDRTLLKVGTGAGAQITFEGRVYQTATLERFGRIACLGNKLYLFAPKLESQTEITLQVYDSQSLVSMPPLQVSLPAAKIIRPVDIVTDGALLYLVLLIEMEQPAICVHVLNAANGTRHLL